jgi:hypothetical protein
LNPEKTKRTTVLLLVLGLGSAVVIYFTAKPVMLDPLLGDPLTNKKYVHELRVMGGKSNVLAAELMAWFGGLWEGRTLAGTVAFITVVVTLAFRWVAARPDIYRSEPVEEEKSAAGVARDR